MVKKGSLDKDATQFQYNDVFLSEIEYVLPFQKSLYFDLWAKVLSYCAKPSIIDIGCGPGQFARIVHLAGYDKYFGVDFSGVAITQCKRLCRDIEGFSFLKGDIRKKSVWEEINSHKGIFTFIEVLEHLTNDLHILSNVPRRSRIIATLPKFDAQYHIRYFENEDDVVNRYSENVEIDKSEDLGRFIIIGGQAK